MKKIILLGLVALCILISALFFQPSTTAQAASEADKVLEILGGGGADKPKEIDPQKDYVGKEIKESKQQYYEKKDGTKLEFGSLKENIVSNDFLFAIYDAKFNGKKGYILLSFLRDKDTKTTWNLMQRFFVSRKDKDVIVFETKLFGTDPVERQKYIEGIVQKFTQDLNKKPIETKSPPKYEPATGQNLPKFFGVYIMQQGKYVEVPSTQFKQERYNQIQRLMGADFNVRGILQRKQFMPTDLETFNREGFIYLPGPEWSTARLWRVPHEGKYDQNETMETVVIYVAASGPGGMPFTLEGLDQPIKSSEVETKQGRAGEGAFVYAPKMQLTKGLYFVDFKKGNEYGGACALELK